MIMKILGISGSPRKNGNTSFAVKYALELLNKDGFKVKFISLSGKKINPCIGCWKCEKTYKCFYEDDMERIIEDLKWCSALIIGSPVYFGMITGQLKAMMDRCIVMRPNYGDSLPMSGKIGAAIACANSRNGGQEITIQNIHTFMLQMNMMIISDGPCYSHSGGTIFGNAHEDSWGLETITNLSRNVGQMLKESASNLPDPKNAF